MIGCWPDSNTPEPSALWLKAALQLGQVERRRRSALAIFTCMMVRVFGP